MMYVYYPMFVSYLMHIHICCLFTIWCFHGGDMWAPGVFWPLGDPDPGSDLWFWASFLTCFAFCLYLSLRWQEIHSLVGFSRTNWRLLLIGKWSCFYIRVELKCISDDSHSSPKGLCDLLDIWMMYVSQSFILLHYIYIYIYIYYIYIYIKNK